MGIHESVLEVQSKVSGIKKNSKGFNYKYENLDSIINLLKEPLEASGLAIRHDVKYVTDSIFMCVTYVFNASGESIEASCPILDPGSVLKSGNVMQGMGSAITYARRYNLKNLFNLFSTDDDAAILTPKAPSKPKIEVIYDLMDELAGNPNFDIDKLFEFAKTKDLNTCSDKVKDQIITILKSKKS